MNKPMLDNVYYYIQIAVICMCLYTLSSCAELSYIHDKKERFISCLNNSTIGTECDVRIK